MDGKHPPMIDLKAGAVVSSSRTRNAPSQPLSNEWEVIISEDERKAPSLRAPVIFGATTLILGIGGFLLWSITTSIAAASIAPGQVVVDGQVKKITLFEGGVLDTLYVKEGDRVDVGEILATLDTTRTKAELIQLEHQAIGLDVKRARLTAERDGLTAFNYSPEKSGRLMDGDTIKNILDVEQNVFKERKKYLEGSISIENSLEEQLDSQARALKARILSYQDQIAIVEVDKASLEGLFKKNLTTKGELSSKQILHMELQSKILETQAALIETAQKISQAKVSILNRRTEFNREVVQSLQEVQLELEQTKQRIVSARDVVDRSTIRSPQVGTIANIDPESRTRGSAIVAGKAIMEIVPTNQELIVDGKLPTRSINDARVNADVEVKLVNSDAYKLDPLFGKLTYIGADSVIDEKSGEAYYPIHVKIPREELFKQPSIVLSPGVRAELYIINGNRTAISYLTQPISESFSRAFREN